MRISFSFLVKIFCVSLGKECSNCLFLKTIFWSSSSQLCLTLCDPMECTVHGILQSRILEWVAFPFSRGSFTPKKMRSCWKILRSDRVYLYRKSNGDRASKRHQMMSNVHTTQGLNPHCRQVLYQLSYQGNLVQNRCSYLLSKWIHIETLKLGRHISLSSFSLSQQILSLFLDHWLENLVEAKTPSLILITP